MAALGSEMIDPFTAFALAQGAVAGIKKAVALGKDINGLIHEFSSFYKAADEVHNASVKLKVQSIRMSDAEIGAQALQMAMHSRALRQHEKELKDILFWSGNADVYYEMQAERKRMIEERQAEDKRIEEQKQKDREMKYNALMATMWFMGSLCIIIPICTILFRLITVKHL
jgi:hypothetical protein